MVKKYIENLKTRTYTQKSNYAFMTSILITGFIAAIWFLTIFANPEGYFKPNNTEAQNLANTGSLFDSLKEGLK